MPDADRRRRSRRRTSQDDQVPPANGRGGRILYEVTPTDALTYDGVPALLALVALGARTQADPLIALRQE